MKSPEKVVNHITQWLANYLEDAKMEGFVVGISGGIDSALTSTLCAITAKPVLCIEMPIKQGDDQLSRSAQHIEWLKQNYPNVSSLKLTLDSVFDSFCGILPQSENKEAHELSLANTRARLRMTSLYYFAALNRYLVCGTGNKVEDFGVGFYTKYGDGGVDLSPIADLLKSEVYAIGKMLNVPESIMKAAPSDGLFGDARSDEDQIGASYPELEWAMKMKDKGKTSEDFNGRQKEVFDIFIRYNKLNKHKMIPVPICEIPKKFM